MSQIEITINGRGYNVACEDGQEEHLQKLASFIDERVSELAGAVGQVGDARLLVMAGLLVADELSDAYAEIDRLRQENASLSENAGEGGNNDEAAAQLLESMADRLDGLAARLEAS